MSTDTTLTILDSRGDTTITWNHTDPKAREEARKTVSDLKAAGYTFFLVDGTPTDEIAAGAGKLLVRRLNAEQVMEEAHEEQEEPPVQTIEQPKRRGRPRKEVVATRALRGG